MANLGYPRRSMPSEWASGKMHDLAYQNGLRLVHGYEAVARRTIDGTIADVLPYHNRQTLEVGDHNTSDIVQLIKKCHKLHCADYDTIAGRHWKGNVKDTAKGLFDFLKDNVRYDVEPEEFQSVKSPGAILHQGYGDCKHYASYITGVCDALQRQGYPIRSKYRFVSDDPNNDVHHVFALVSGQGETFHVDPVLRRFDMRPTFHNIKDTNMQSIGELYRISGVGDTALGEISRNFQNQGQILNFLHRHGAHPRQFRDAAHLARFMAHKMHNPRSGARPEHFAHVLGMHDENVIGKKKGHKNFLKSIAHGFKVNTQNIKHGIEVNAANAKTMALKVSLGAARGPFLSLVDLNAFNLAHRLQIALTGPNRGKLLDKWKSLGGDPNALIRCVNRGYKEYKKKHGGFDATRDTIHGIGVVQVAALLALASAIIAALQKFLPKPTPEDAQAMADGAKSGAMDIAQGAVDGEKGKKGDGGQPDDSAGAMAVTTGVDDNGTPTVTVHSVTHPAIQAASDGTEGATNSPSNNAGPANTDGDAGDNTADASAKPNALKETFAKVSEFVSEHKTAVGVGAAAVAALYLYKEFGSKKTKRR